MKVMSSAAIDDAVIAYDVHRRPGRSARTSSTLSARTAFARRSGSRVSGTGLARTASCRAASPNICASTVLAVLARPGVVAATPFKKRSSWPVVASHSVSPPMGTAARTGDSWGVRPRGSRRGS